MTIRGVTLGLLLGLLVSAGTYFNDWVIGQTPLVGNFLPISVFGIASFILFVVNPILSRIPRIRQLSGGEIAVMAAIGLASCGFPGSSFFRVFAPATALPAHWYKTSPSWQATGAMSYLPGGSSRLGQGHVKDWVGLTTKAMAASQAAPPSPGKSLYGALGAEGKRLFDEVAADGSAPLGVHGDLTRSVNDALESPDFYSEGAFANVRLSPETASLLADKPAPKMRLKVNRALLAAAFPEHVLPAPEGKGALVDGGRADPFVTDTLLQGRGQNSQLGVSELPWQTWWPSIKLWWGAALLLGIAALCIMLIVHPQWAHRELLAYPIVRFVREASERAKGQKLPVILKNKLFWVGVASMVLLHGINGLHAWFSEIPEIPRKFDFSAFYAVFEDVGRVSGQYGWFGPTIFASVIAFAFFMPNSVSFSLGVSHLLFFAFGVAMLSAGLQLDSDLVGQKRSNLLRVGGYLAFAAMILYTGRHFYFGVLRSALGFERTKETPAYSVWATRALGLVLTGAVIVISSSGLGWFLATVLVLLVLLTFLVMTRIVCETGAFFLQTGWSPVGAIFALAGFEALGPTAVILLGMATVMLTLDARELLMPFLASGLKLVDSEGLPGPSRFWAWQLLMVVTGFLVAGIVTLHLQYNNSIIQVGNDYATHQVPRISFDLFAREAAEAASDGTLVSATWLSGLDRLEAIQPSDIALPWLGIGLVLVLVTAAARLRLPWWPLHPVAFLVWDTYPIITFGPSFLLGWMVKAGVVGTTGARGYHQVKPLMIGVIAGELLSGLFWMGIGTTYYFITGRSPVTYAIFPL